jgi:arylformamidase
MPQREAAYSPSKALPDGNLQPFIQDYIDKSALAYAQLSGVQTLSYGSLASNTVDLVLPETGGPAPLLVFIHGGYWQELSKRESFFGAVDTLNHGIGFAAIDYTLAPKASIDDIVAECLAAVSMLIARADGLGIDADRIVLAGSSAGAHLSAMCASALGRQLKGLVLLSGIYELEPLIGTYINEALGMGQDSATRNSPALQDLKRFPSTLVDFPAPPF